MGEIADMMLEGSMCELCGEYLGEGDGFPVRCCEEVPPQPTEPTQRQKRNVSRNARRSKEARARRAAQKGTSK